MTTSKRNKKGVKNQKWHSPSKNRIYPEIDFKIMNKNGKFTPKSGFSRKNVKLKIKFI